MSSNSASGELSRILDRADDNVGRIITVFTRSGGCSGRGFTGLLIHVDCDVIELITRFPSAPRHPFGNQFSFNDFAGSGCSCQHDRFGTRIVIPVRDIVAVVFNEL